MTTKAKLVLSLIGAVILGGNVATYLLYEKAINSGVYRNGVIRRGIGYHGVWVKHNIGHDSTYFYIHNPDTMVFQDSVIIPRGDEK